MQALILAGGAGTRLHPVLGGLNKPMAPVANKPFLEYLLLQLKKHEIDEVILCVGYKADLIQSYFGSGDRWDLRISYSYETDFRGTAGALKLAEHFIHEEDFFVMNGDSLFDIELRALMHYHCKRQATVTLALANVGDTQRYGAVAINELGQIVSFIEKGVVPLCKSPTRYRASATHSGDLQGVSNSAGLINGGIYVFARQVLDFIPGDQAISLEQDILPNLIGRDLYGLPLDGYFIDIGVPAAYLKVCSAPWDFVGTRL